METSTLDLVKDLMTAGHDDLATKLLLLLVEQSDKPSPKETRKSSTKTPRKTSKKTTRRASKKRMPTPTEKELSARSKKGWNSYVRRCNRQGFDIKAASTKWRPARAAWKAENAPSEKVFVSPTPTESAPKVTLEAPAPSEKDTIEEDRKALRARMNAEKKARRDKQVKAASLCERVKENATAIASIQNGINDIMAHLTAQQ